MRVVIFFLLFSVSSYAQNVQPTDSSFASQFTGTYHVSNDTSIQLFNMKSYLKGVAMGGEVFHFLWISGDRFRVQNKNYQVEFKRSGGMVTGFDLLLPHRRRYFSKSQ